MPDPAASAAVVFVNLIATAGWFLLLLALDPNRRAKKTARALLECYLLGLGSVALATALAGGPAAAGRLPGGELGFLRTGLVEEAAKFLVFFAITRTMRSPKEPLDGVLQAAAVALAFASEENLLYGVRFASVGVVLKRALIATTGHLSYAAIWGLFTACLRFSFLKGKARAGRRVLALDALSLLVAFRFLRSLARQPLYGAEPIAQPEKTLRLLHGSWQQGGDIPWAWPTCPAAIPPRRCAIWAAAGP